ncbi:MAG: deoxyribonuclease IV [candidate division WOR-3 bacterium]|nr:deoxyribonuclease IV [candidate division WOR-3 bacterium]
MKLGFHISIAGGFKNVYKRAKSVGCQTIQIFSRNPRSWKYKKIDEEDSEIFKKQIKEYEIAPVFIHLPYINNLGSADDILFTRSVASLIEDLRRAEKLNAQYLITHCGSNPDLEKGIKRMSMALNQALSETNNKIIILIENTAGSGNEFGYKFEHLQDILSELDPKRTGIVLDTAHAFAGGYDLRTEKGVNETINKLEKTVGIERIHLVHLNDSRVKLGSRKDRHWHIGQGEIGKGLEFIVNHPALKHLPFIMETPRSGVKDDLMNIAAVRKMIRNS